MRKTDDHPLWAPGYARHRSRILRNFALLREDPGLFFRKVRSWLRPMEQPYRRQWNRGVRRWMIDYQKECVFDKVSWMGVPARKMVLDAWVYQDIISQTKPDLIIEIGNKFGGSTLYLAHVLDLIGRGQVIGVDIDHSVFQPRHPRIRLVTGDSLSAETLAQVEALAGNSRGMVIHDGDHTGEHVLADLRAYAKFVAPGSYLIVEDTVADLFRAGDGLGSIVGTMDAVRKFVGEDSRFVSDADREYFTVTFNPRGYLRRVR